MGEGHGHGVHRLEGARRVDEAHRAAQREWENPPHFITRIEHDAAWAEIWVTGLDSEFWFYRVCSAEREAALVGYHPGGPAGRFESHDPLLSAHHGEQIWPNEDGWKRYLRRWLDARVAG